ncbi:MAG: cobalt-precorrin-6A synthase [Deltaproteobacteria bacterium]|nr:MAG: cobalt-precorrin-6A synthase [Deltaproteobacteria bacterium]
MLRGGFTTGSAAAAATKEALLYLAYKNSMTSVEIPLPDQGRIQIPVKAVKEEGEAVKGVVIKDAGDDPDVTHGAEIWAIVRLDPKGKHGQVKILGGKGVGLVTRAGLPVAVGKPAINPAPRAQIERTVRETLKETGLRGAVRVEICVPKGEELAKETLNPRLGIVGGISILGTRGTVIPFSHEAYRETITLGLDVAKAGGLDHVVLSTGGRSERFVRRILKDLPEIAFIQIADFFAFSLKEASRRGFSRISISCFFGKLLKMAQGHPCTHSKNSSIDFKRLSRWCAEKGMGSDLVKRIEGANTAREALEWIMSDANADRIIQAVVEEALKTVDSFIGQKSRVSYYLFSTEGELLSEAHGDLSKWQNSM